MREKIGDGRPCPELLHLCPRRHPKQFGDKLQPHLPGLPQYTSMYISCLGSLIFIWECCCISVQLVLTYIALHGHTFPLLETITSTFLLLNSYQKLDSKEASKEDLPAHRQNMHYMKSFKLSPESIQTIKRLHIHKTSFSDLGFQIMSLLAKKSSQWWKGTFYCYDWEIMI